MHLVGDKSPSTSSAWKMKTTEKRARMTDIILSSGSTTVMVNWDMGQVGENVLVMKMSQSACWKERMKLLRVGVVLLDMHWEGRQLNMTMMMTMRMRRRRRRRGEEGDSNGKYLENNEESEEDEEEEEKEEDMNKKPAAKTRAPTGREQQSVIHNTHRNMKSKMVPDDRETMTSKNYNKKKPRCIKGKKG